MSAVGDAGMDSDSLRSFRAGLGLEGNLGAGVDDGTAGDRC